jgi:phospholipid/cholesterol/gamma-HCH transport system substrate-binding protein
MKKYALETTVGLFVVAGLLCVGYMAVTLGNVSIGGGDTYVLRARFTTVSGLKVGSPVEIYGSRRALRSLTMAAHRSRQPG